MDIKHSCELHVLIINEILYALLLSVSCFLVKYYMRLMRSRNRVLSVRPDSNRAYRRIYGVKSSELNPSTLFGCLSFTGAVRSRSHVLYSVGGGGLSGALTKLCGAA